MIKLCIGFLIILVSFPIGFLLAKLTKEELKQGQKWFKLIIIFSGVGAMCGLIFSNDVLFFSFLFIMAVTGQSILQKKKFLIN